MITVLMTQISLHIKLKTITYRGEKRTKTKKDAAGHHIYIISFHF